MNDNCLGELHLLANIFFVGKYYVVMMYYTVHFFFLGNKVHYVNT